MFVFDTITFSEPRGTFLDIQVVFKLRSEMNQTKLSPKILLMKSSGNNFIFLPVFYRIM
jgi:hypothetical protein